MLISAHNTRRFSPESSLLPNQLGGWPLPVLNCLELPKCVVQPLHVVPAGDVGCASDLLSLHMLFLRHLRAQALILVLLHLPDHVDRPALVLAEPADVRGVEILVLLLALLIGRHLDGFNLLLHKLYFVLCCVAYFPCAVLKLEVAFPVEFLLRILVVALQNDASHSWLMDVVRLDSHACGE